MYNVEWFDISHIVQKFAVRALKEFASMEKRPRSKNKSCHANCARDLKQPWMSVFPDSAAHSST